MTGLIQIYTGNGKGKTTAAFGLAIRANGRGFKVAIVQFLKSRDTGEVSFIRQNSNIDMFRVNTSEKFTWEMNPEELENVVAESRKGFEQIKSLTFSNKYDLIILDEIIHSINKEYIGKDELLAFFAERPKNVELVLTGRDAPEWLIEAADLCSEMRCIKHPYEKGIPARVGIEN
jgi:ATP:corrinoid adenosyltransferase